MSRSERRIELDGLAKGRAGLGRRSVAPEVQSPRRTRPPHRGRSRAAATAVGVGVVTSFLRTMTTSDTRPTSSASGRASCASLRGPRPGVSLGDLRLGGDVGRGERDARRYARRRGECARIVRIGQTRGDANPVGGRLGRKRLEDVRDVRHRTETRVRLLRKRAQDGVLTDPPPPLKGRTPDLAQPIEDTILRSLSKEPHARFGSMADVADVLEPFASQTTADRIRVTPASVPIRTMRAHSPRRRAYRRASRSPRPTSPPKRRSPSETPGRGRASSRSSPCRSRCSLASCRSWSSCARNW